MILANVSVKINGRIGRPRWKTWSYELIREKAELTNIFCAYLVCIYFCECHLKENFVKSTKIWEICRKNTRENYYT